MTLINKNSRRDFLKVGALATAAALLPRTNLLAAPATQHAGLQLYTLRNELAKDVEGTLRQVAKIGYKEVELFGYNGTYFGKSAADMKALLKSLNLAVPSGHYTVGKAMKGKGTLLDGWKQAVDDAATLGQQYMVCAYLFPAERTKLDDYKEYADLFNKSAEVCKSAGIQFCYHNHDFEFKEMDGQLPYDLLLKNTDPKLVKLELDLYWATFAGQDPVALFKKSPGRYPLWHVKDMEKEGDHTFAPVGTGSINFQRIFDAKKIAGMTHYFVEQDQTKGPALDAIATSYKNLGKLNV